MGIFDFLLGNNSTDGTNTGNGDAVSSYLGNLIDPATSQQYQDANRNRTLLGLAAGLLGQGASRFPISFGQSFGSGLQGALQAQNGFSDQALKAAQTGNTTTDTGLKKAQVLNLMNQMALQNLRVNAATDQYNEQGSGVPNLSNPSLTQGSGAGSVVSSTTADATLPPHARALLDTIAGPESKGAYNIRYTPKGGATFDSFAKHPAIFEPGPDGPSSAAGRYQIVKSTFDPLAQQYGYKDFAPVTQDQAAWQLAQNTYRDKTGSDLLADLQGGNTSKVGAALGSQWATLNRAMPNYASNLAKYANAGTGPSDQASGLPSIPNFSGQMTGNGGVPYTGMPQLPSQVNSAPSGYGVPNSQDIRGARYRVELDSALGRTPNPNDVAVAGFATSVGLDAAKQSQQKRLELQYAGPMVNAQETARRPFGTTTTTIRNPDGSYSEGPIPNTIFDAIAARSFPGLTGQPAPTPVQGSSFATNLPRFPSQPAPQGAPAPGGMMPDINTINTGGRGPQGMEYVFGKTIPRPILGPDGKIAAYPPQSDAKGNIIGPAQYTPVNPADPLWSTPDGQAMLANPVRGRFPTANVQGGPQSTGNAPAATPVASQAAASPAPSYTLGKPVLNPTAQFDPYGYNFSPKVGQGPGQNQPLTVPSTSDHPYTTQIPALSEQAPLRMSGVNAGDIQKGWVATSQKLADAQQGIQQSKQLLNTMANIFQRYDAGSFAQYQSELMAGLNSMGVATPNGVNNPADAQVLLKDVFANALATMKASGIPRITQMEIKLASENFANPNLRPAANFSMITNDMGKVLQAEALSKDWAIANRNGWVDPSSFSTQWFNQPANDLQVFVGRAAVQMPAFKGMSPQEQKQQIPTLGTAPDGTRVMKLSNGKVVSQ